MASRKVTDVQQSVFDRLLHVSTTGHLYLDQVGLGAPDRAFYLGSQWIPVRRALKSLHPGPDDVLVDLGAGKGRAVLIAGRLPFGRVIGVELAPVLAEEARRNVAAAGPRLRAGQVEVITADALTWEVPDDLSVVFLFSPFIGDLFNSVLGRIFESFDARPRRLNIVYMFPWKHNWLLDSGRVVVRDVLPAEWPPKPWWWRTGWVTVIYQVVGPGEGGSGAPHVRRRFLRPTAALEHWSSPNDQVFRLVGYGQVEQLSN